MRTPGHDEELALGFCLSEGLAPRDAALPRDLSANTVEVTASNLASAEVKRNFFTSSSCGVCGKGARSKPSPSKRRAWRAECAWRRASSRGCHDACGKRRLRSMSRVDCTRPVFSGSRASCCAFGKTSAGTTRWIRSWAGRFATTASRLRMLSSASAAGCHSSSCRRRRWRVARCWSRSAPRAPSSLAVELAADRGVTLCGFVRDSKFNLYSEPWRVTN
jgi:FdhD protein